MSASSIARWNAIPMSREPDDQSSNKRTRSDDDDNSSEDNVSFVSRTPSPQPDRDVEMKDVYGYDEHVRGVAREVITVETKIKNTNKGFAMLAKMGWAEGTPLGLSGDGRVDPVPFTVKQDSTGLGKATQDFRMIETTVSQRRNLDSERMQFETAEQRQQREASFNGDNSAGHSQMTSFSLSFQNVAQYDEHTNSYAHHHKARARDMNANHPVRAGGREEAERRREKERKREEKELRKLARAAGIKLSAPPVARSAASSTPRREDNGFKKSGWASVSDALPSSTSATPASSTPEKIWAPVSGPAPSAPSGSPPPPPSASAPPPPIHQGFRSGGWSTLATSIEAPSTPSPNRGVSTPPLPPPPPFARLGPPPPPPRVDSLPLPPPPRLPPSTPSSWSRLPSASPSSQPQSADHGSWNVRPSTEGAPPTGIPLTSVATPPNPQNQPTSPATSNPSSEQRKSKAKSKSKMTFDEEATAQSRGNWQNFQKMRGRR
ncbi:hypothetical protein A7U60_g4294 [Sanghuangporus baumii]|uniref:G-patch domain-containing protein n=1 Tax=Sanghuangporus baumii TaxID=108892 RepID=A0A9Q5N9D0_SANBA|nr:hypothetical protein A7U60_g4294 [Sanghuangporus baumii]